MLARTVSDKSSCCCSCSSSISSTSNLLGPSYLLCLAANMRDSYVLSCSTPYCCPPWLWCLASSTLFPLQKFHTGLHLTTHLPPPWLRQTLQKHHLKNLLKQKKHTTATHHGHLDTKHTTCPCKIQQTTSHLPDSENNRATLEH
jgi:hypothetical protein